MMFLLRRLIPHLVCAALLGSATSFAAEPAVPSALATMKVSEVKHAAESAILRIQTRLRREDLRFQYAYHRIEPGRLVNADVVVAVYDERSAREVHREEVGSMFKITLSRNQHTVEMQPNGQLIRVSTRAVEETEIREKSPR